MCGAWGDKACEKAAWVEPPPSLRPYQVLGSPELRKSYDLFGLVESRRIARQLSFERWQQQQPRANRGTGDSSDSTVSPQLPPARRYTVAHSPSTCSGTTKPPCKPPPRQGPPPLPADWMVAHDVEGSPYYYNLTSGENTYDRPGGAPLPQKAKSSPQPPPSMVAPLFSPRADTATAAALETQAIATAAWLATEAPRPPLPQRIPTARPGQSPPSPTPPSGARLTADCRRCSFARSPPATLPPAEPLTERLSPPLSTAAWQPPSSTLPKDFKVAQLHTLAVRPLSCPNTPGWLPLCRPAPAPDSYIDVLSSRYLSFAWARYHLTST